MLKKCGEPNAAGHAQLKIRWKSPLATSSFRGSVSRIGFSFSVTRSIASSQEISFQPGSSPGPFFGFVRTIGALTRFGS